MNFRIVSTFVLGLVVSAAAVAQGANPTSQDSQNSGNGQRSGRGGGYGQRGGGMGMGGMGAGRGLMGSVSEVTADHYTIKTTTGETYTIHYSVNTRFMKQPAGMRGQGQGQGQAADAGQAQSQDNQGGARAGRNGQGRGQGFGGGEAVSIKSTDIKVGDAIAAMGEVDAAGKSVGAVGVFLLDPERAKQMQQLQADYGKTWLMGKVTAIQDVQVTLTGSIDNAPHTFVADENTTFRERNNPVTLADIQVGDMVRTEGSLHGTVFTATSVNVMNPPNGANRGQRNAPPPQ